MIPVSSSMPIASIYHPMCFATQPVLVTRRQRFDSYSSRDGCKRPAGQILAGKVSFTPPSSEFSGKSLTLYLAIYAAVQGMMAGEHRGPKSKQVRQNYSVIATNNSSIVSKRSVERLYYPEPHFYRYFVKKPLRRSPLINRK